MISAKVLVEIIKEMCGGKEKREELDKMRAETTSKFTQLMEGEIENLFFILFGKEYRALEL